MDELIVKKYPFLSKAKGLVGENEVSYDELIEAKNAVLTVLSRKPNSSMYLTAKDAARSQALQRLLLSALNNDFVSSKYAFALAKKFVKSLSQEKDDEFYVIAKDFFSSLASDYSVSLIDYLVNGGSHLETEDVKEGRIFFDRAGLTSLLRDALITKTRKFKKLRKQELPKIVKEVAKELVTELPRESTAHTFKGKYASMPCVKTLVTKGALEGKRYYGAMTISVALINDRVPRGEAESVMKDYVSKCSQGNNDYSLHEGLSVLDWVYKHPGIRFSCKTFRDQFGAIACTKCKRYKRK